MNATIDRYIYVTVSSLDQPVVRFERLDSEVVVECPLGGPMPLGRGVDLHIGVYQRVVRDFLGGTPAALRISSLSESPEGSGLGSSSTLVVALLQAMVEFFALPLGEYEVAHLAYQIEREDLKLAGGKQDQYAATFGGFNFMEFYGDGITLVNPLKIKESIVSELEASLVLCFTGVSRQSADIIASQVENVRNNAAAPIEAMHALKEESIAMKRCLLKGDLAGFAATLQSGWEAKKRMAGAITNPQIDRFEQVAKSAGALATKVSGAGGGGFLMFFANPENRLRLIRRLTDEGGAVSGCRFTAQGACAWRVG
jgi:D-glycero-alpha-D-manno-heptose-7-phosphate kinase